MKTYTFLISFVLLISVSSFAQQSDPFEKWNWLIGKWNGEGSGNPGEGNGYFTFSKDLGEKVIIRKGHTEFPATEKSPRAIHDDLMIIYFDYPGSEPKAVYFDNEGHTIYYKIEFPEKDITFISQKSGNMPVFRLTYKQIDEGAVNVKFEISKDGINFAKYLEGKSLKEKQ